MQDPGGFHNPLQTLSGGIPQERLLKILSYNEDLVQKKTCGCMKDNWCSWDPWERKGLPTVDYFFNYREGCRVNPEDSCYFKAPSTDPRTHETSYYSFEPCEQWKRG